MRYCFFLLAILVVALLQSSVLWGVGFWKVKPDLLFAVVVIVSLLLEFRQAFIFSLASGIFKDLLGFNHLAINTFLFPLWSFLIIKAAKRISWEGRLRQMVFIFIAAVINTAAGRLLFFSTSSQIPVGIFLRTLLFEAVYTTLLAQGIFVLVSSRFSLKDTLKSNDGPDLESGIE
jgi:rod shape-determining protein MreD